MTVHNLWIEEVVHHSLTQRLTDLLELGDGVRLALFEENSGSKYGNYLAVRRRIKLAVEIAKEGR